MIKHYAKKLYNYFRHSLRLDVKDYDEEFYSKDKSFAKQMAKVIDDVLQPESVAELGAGGGEIMQQFRDRNHVAIDMSSDAREFALSNNEGGMIYEVSDLRDEVIYDQRYGLCICLEVVEHIHKKYVDNLILNLKNASDTILFTAAAPGQSGTNHVNCQNIQYWIIKLRPYQIDYPTTTKLRNELSKVPKIPWFYIQNLYLFKKPLCENEQ